MIRYDAKASEPLRQVLTHNIDCKAFETLINNFNLHDLKDQKLSLKADSSQQLDFQSQLDIQAHIWRNHHLLGAVSNQDNQLFFESRDSIECGKYFLSEAYSVPIFKELVISTHKESCARQNKKTPMCISFLTFTINNKKYCLIELSKNSSAKMLEAHISQIIIAINLNSYLPTSLLPHLKQLMMNFLNFY